LDPLTKEFFAFIRILLVGQTVPVAKAIRDLLFGMVLSGTCILSRIAEHLEESDSRDRFTPRDPRYIVKRFSRVLGQKDDPEVEKTNHYDDAALDLALHEHLSAWTLANDGEDCVWIVDFSDLAFPFSGGCAPHKEGMRCVKYLKKKLPGAREALGDAYDGSKGYAGPGYGVALVAASLPAGGKRRAVLPFLAHMFSNEEGGTATRTAARAMIAQIRRILPYIGPLSWVVADRGFDTNPYMTSFDNLNIRWIVRVKIRKGSRAIKLADGRTDTIQKLLLGIETPVPHSRLDRKGRLKRIRLGAVHVVGWRNNRENDRWYPCNRTLVVIRNEGRGSICLLVGQHLDLTPAMLRRISMRSGVAGTSRRRFSA
jgi:hypothetical protein